MEALEHLTERGHRCHLIAFSNPDMPRLRYLNQLTVHEVEAEPHQRSTLRFAFFAYLKLQQIDWPTGEVWCGSFAGNSGLALSLFKLLSHRSFYMFSFRRGAQLKKLHIEFQRTEPSLLYRRVKVALHKLITRTMLRSSDLLITQTEIGLRQLKEEYPSSIPPSTAILPNNLNTRWINRKRSDAQSKVLPEMKDGFRVCFVGRMRMKEKGVDTLLEAATKLRAKPIVFDLVGAGGDMDAVRSTIDERELASTVRLHGWMENPLRVMKYADLVIVPSRADPLPNVVLEGLAMEKPVIGSNVDGIAVMLNHPDLLFEPGNAGQLAFMIDRAHKDREHYTYLQKKCRHLAEKFRFDWGSEFEEIFKATLIELESTA
jgi:glycosyltransferase involved in cell wall biosynthesis